MTQVHECPEGLYISDTVRRLTTSHAIGGAMARVDAYWKLNIDSIDLNWYVRNYVGEDLRDNLNNPWEDNYHVFGTNVDAYAWSLYGSGLGYDAGGIPTLGTVEAISEWVQNPDTGTWLHLYRISELNTPLRDFVNAARTESTSDDIALLRSEFSGRDTINLSAFDDHMRGFGGNDKMYGHNGSDLLRGDSGKDKLYGGAGNDTLKGGDGDDILRGGNGRDKEFGGGGEDVFRFRTGDDKSIIRDFDAVGSEHDVIDLSGLASVGNWSDLKNNHMEQIGSHVEIDGEGGDIIVIKDVTLASLDKGDFLF